MVVRVQLAAQLRCPRLCLLVAHKQDYTFGVGCRLWNPLATHTNIMPVNIKIFSDFV